MKSVHANYDVFHLLHEVYDTKTMKIILIFIFSIAHAQTQEKSSSLHLAGIVHSYAKMKILSVIKTSHTVELTLHSMTNMKENQHKIVFSDETEKLIPYEMKMVQSNPFIKNYSVPLKTDNSTIKLNIIMN
jgi:hypothetical protein